jgi:hypothetical protein
MQISKSPIISGYVVSEKNIFEILSKVESIIGQLAWPVRGGSVDTTVQG